MRLFIGQVGAIDIQAGINGGKESKENKLKH